MGIEKIGKTLIFADVAEVGRILDLYNFIEVKESWRPSISDPTTGSIEISMKLKTLTFKKFMCLVLGIRYRRKVRWRNILKFRMETDPWR